MFICWPLAFSPEVIRCCCCCWRSSLRIFQSFLFDQLDPEVIFMYFNSCHSNKLMKTKVLVTSRSEVTKTRTSVPRSSGHFMTNQLLRGGRGGGRGGLLFIHRQKPTKTWHCTGFIKSCLFLCSLFSSCLLLVYCLFTACLLLVYSLFTACLLLVYSLFTSCLRLAYSLFTACLLLAYSLFTPCLLLVYSLFTACLLLAYFLFTACLLLVYGLFTACLLLVYSLFTACLLLVYCLFTSCLLLVYCLLTPCLRLVYYLFTSCLLLVYCLFTACLRLVYCLFTPCPAPRWCQSLRALCDCKYCKYLDIYMIVDVYSAFIDVSGIPHCDTAFILLLNEHVFGPKASKNNTSLLNVILNNNGLYRNNSEGEEYGFYNQTNLINIRCLSLNQV